MNVIDKRTNPLTATFGDLAVGDAFQDCNGELGIKTDFCSAMLWYEEKKVWLPCYSYEKWELVTPLEITYTIEEKKGN